MCIANRLVPVISGVDGNTDNRKRNARETVQAKINKYKNVHGSGRGYDDDDDDRSLLPNGQTNISVADYAEHWISDKDSRGVDGIDWAGFGGGAKRERE